jgi:phage-related protein
VQPIYYRDSTGYEPVRAYIDALPYRKAAAIENQLRRFELQRPGGPPPPFPWTSQLDGELREFRAHYGEERYRVLYRRSKNLIILLHIIRKTTGSVPAADVAVARSRWADFKARMDAPKRVRPRAAGHDVT